MSRSSVYRASEIGNALAEVLAEFIDSEALPIQFYDIAFVHFDARLHDQFMRDSRAQGAVDHLSGRIKGSVQWYRCVNNVYTFALRDVTLFGVAFTGASDHAAALSLPVSWLKVVAVDGRNIAGAPNPQPQFSSGDTCDHRGQIPQIDEPEPARQAPVGGLARTLRRCGRPTELHRVPQYDGLGNGDGSFFSISQGSNTLSDRQGGAASGHGTAGSNCDDEFDDDDVVVATHLDMGMDDPATTGHAVVGGDHVDSQEELVERVDARLNDRTLTSATEDGGEEEGLNSDDDDIDDVASLFGTNDSVANGGNLVLAHFDKVRRARALWKVSLNHGLSTLHGMSYAFARADCEFTWMN